MVSWSMTGRESAVTVIARRAARLVRRSTRATRVRLVAALTLALRLVLVLAACAALVASAWMVAVPLGLLAGGVALFFLEWLVKDGSGGSG